MSLGPIELLMVAFPGNRVTGRIVPELATLVHAGTIRVVDGVYVLKEESGDLVFHELDEPGADLAELRALLTEPLDLVSSEDVEELAASLAPGSAAALIALEHLWAKPLRDAVSDSGGMVLADVVVPGDVVDEVLSAIAS